MKNNSHTYINKYVKQALCVLLLLVSFSKAYSQIGAAFTSSLLTDSLVAANNKDFLYDNLTINNTSGDKLNMVITITVPGKWQLVTDNVVTITLDRSASTIIPISLLPGNGTRSTWEQVSIQYKLVSTGEIRNDYINVKERAFTKFKASLRNPNMMLPGYQKIISIPVSIKNTGNTRSDYKISFHNDFLHLDDNASITLDAGADSIYTIPLSITESEYAMLKQEDITITVANKGDLVDLVQTVSKVGSMLKDHASAYADMPLQLEAGATYQGKGTPVQYYGGLYGSVDLDQKDRISLSLRSGMISGNNPVDNNLMKVDYTGEHIQASLGNIMEMSDFPMDGYGAKAGYSWGKNNNDKIVLFGELKSVTGHSNIYGGLFQHGLTKKIKLTSNISTDEDKDAKLNSGVVRQTVDVKFSSKAKLQVIGGASAEESTAQIVNGTGKQYGSSFGYNFQYTSKYLSVLSNVLDNSNGFAGIYKGQKTQTHDVRLIHKKFFVGGYYEYSYSKQNSYYDSLLVSNFNMLTNNYGIRAGWSNKFATAAVSAGNQQQEQSGEGNNFTSSYNYVNLNATAFISKKINLNINSYAGTGSVLGMPINNVFISSTQGTLQFYNGGVAFRYDKGPFYYSDFATYIDKPVNMERMMLSPYVDMSLFKKSFNLRAQYNYMEGTPNTPVTSSVVMNLSYANVKKGYDLHLTGMLPVNNSTNVQPYMTATVRVRINAPCMAIKKYNTIKIVLFMDANSNGILDKGEKTLAGQMVSINGNLFISDEDGVITYKNVANGIYKADLRYGGKVKGWAPASGPVQTIEVNGNNATQYIAFSKCRVLQGKLILSLDSNSNLKFSTANIKVIVTTTDSNVYSTLTDDNGEFYLNLPANNYVVTLSQAAFDEHFKPTQYSQNADLINNETKNVYFEIRQRKREINISRE